MQWNPGLVWHPFSRYWLSLVEELRSQLAVNVNRRVVSDALFLAMAGG